MEEVIRVLVVRPMSVQEGDARYSALRVYLRLQRQFWLPQEREVLLMRLAEAVVDRREVTEHPLTVIVV